MKYEHYYECKCDACGYETTACGDCCVELGWVQDGKQFICNDCASKRGWKFQLPCSGEVHARRVDAVKHCHGCAHQKDGHCQEMYGSSGPYGYRWGPKAVRETCEGMRA